MALLAICMIYICTEKLIVEIKLYLKNMYAYAT